MTGMTPRDTREWMRTIERGLLQARGAASSIAGAVVEKRLNDYATVVNNDRNRVPAPPIELTTQTYIALGANKRFQAGVIVDFPDVTIGNDALPMTIEQYELWGRTGTANFGLLTTATESSLQWFGADPGAVWDFKVRAIGALSVKPGVFSSVVTVTMLNDTTAPGMPSTPTAQGQGRAITIKWDGKVAGGADMPLDLDYVVIAGGPDPSPTTEISRFTPGPGLFVDAMVPYNTPMFYRLQAVDTSGNRSAWSAQASAVGMPLVDDDIIMAQINAAETEIINIGAASILNGAINSAKLADNAVSQAKLQDQIISLAKLDTAVDAKIQQGIDDAFAAATAAATADGKAVNAQSSANGKNNLYYGTTKPAGSSFADGDTAFIRTGVGAPITEQWKWIKTGPTTGSWNQETLGHQVIASVDLGKATVGELNGIYVKAFSLGADTLKVGSSTNLFPDSKMLDTAGWPTTAGVTLDGAGTGKNGQGSILIAGSGTQVGLYYSNNDLAKRIPVQPNSSYRLNVWVRAGVTVPVGTVSVYARQYPLDGSAFSFTTPDRISNDAKSVGGDGTIAANTWTLMSGVVTTGPTDTSLVVGLYKQPGMTSAVRFSDPTIEVMGVGRLIVDGTIQGVHVAANSIAAKHMTITDLTNFAPSLAESPTDWTLTNQMQIVTSGLDTSGWRFQVTDAVSESRAYGPFMAVSPGENLWMGATLYRGSATINAYLRYYFYDATKTLLSGGAGTQYVNVPQSAASSGGTRMEGPALVPAGAAYTRIVFIVSAGTGSTGFYNIVGRRRLAGELIIDGTVTSDKVATNGITAKQLLVGDFANIAIGSDFEDASAVPWILDPLHTLTTSQKKSGTTSLKLAAGPGVDSSVFVGDLRVKEGEQYYFKYHAYIDATFNGTTSNSKLRITDQAGGNVVSLSYASITRSAWTTNPLEVTYTVPAGVTSLKVYMNSDHTVGTAYVDDVQIRRVSEASLIMNLGVEKLVANAANIGTAVVDKFYSEVVRSRRITTDMMTVGRGVNGIVDEFFEAADLKTYRDANNGGWGGWGFNATINLNWYGGTLTAGTSRSFIFETVGTYDKNSYIPVEPGQVWRLSAQYTSTVSGPRATVKVVKRDGTLSYTTTGWLKKDGTTNSYAAAGSQQTLERVYTVPSDVAYMMPAVQFESTCTSAYVYGGATMTNMASAALIVEGAIATRHLTVTEDMTVKLLAAHKILATEIDTNNLGADVGFIGVMTGNILTVDSINGTMISATGGITSKHTITGATIQTLSTASRGVKISGGNFTAYNTGGGKTFEIVGSSGAVSGTGVWKTGSSGNFIEMTADGGGGLLKFWTGTGTGRGTIYARDDAGGKRMTVSYSDLDNPGYTVPLMAYWDDQVNMSYGSKVIKVGKAAGGGEEMVLDADGARVRVLGNFSLESGRLQTYYNWANTATIGGYVGQRPETAVTTNDFEVRAASGSVRLSGTDLYCNPIYNNTTASSANVFVGSDGLVKRVSSASRYKVDQRLMQLSDTLLDIPVKDWLDKAAWDEKAQLEALPMLEGLDLERYNALVLDRFPGVIAEEVEQAEGGEQFVVYGQDGQTESVMYDRLAIAQINVLYRRLLEAEQKITELMAV